jgi:hypothetical protein
MARAVGKVLRKTVEDAHRPPQEPIATPPSRRAAEPLISKAFAPRAEVPRTIVVREKAPAADAPRAKRAAPTVVLVPPYQSKPAPGSAEEKILQALAEPTVVDFLDTPLTEVTAHLHARHGIEIALDNKALRDVGTDTNTPVTCTMKGVSLRTVLDLMLRDLDLTWTIEEEVLLITTPEEASTRLVTKVYDVTDLVTCRSKDGQLWEDYDSLIDAITGTIKPESWEDVGGAGAVDPVNAVACKTLVIAQTNRIHDEVAKLLAELRAAAKHHGTDEWPPRRERPPAKPPWTPGPFSSGNSGMGGAGGAGNGPVTGMGMF